jgi:hypothetical protein
MWEACKREGKFQFFVFIINEVAIVVYSEVTVRSLRRIYERLGGILVRC